MLRNAILLLYLLFLSVFDIRNKRVPVICLALGVLGSCGVLFVYDGLEWGVLKAIAPGSFIIVISWITGKVGYADGMVLLIIGIIKGFEGSLFVLGISLLLMTFLCIGLLGFKKVKMQTGIPYIPFVTAAFSLLWIVQG